MKKLNIYLKIIIYFQRGVNDMNPLEALFHSQLRKQREERIEETIKETEWLKNNTFLKVSRNEIKSYEKKTNKYLIFSDIYPNLIKDVWKTCYFMDFSLDSTEVPKEIHDDNLKNISVSDKIYRAMKRAEKKK